MNFLQKTLHKFFVSSTLFDTERTARRSTRGKASKSREDSRKTRDYKKIRKLPQREQLRILSRICPPFSRAVEIYRSFVNTEITVDAEDDAVEQAIEDYLEEMIERGITLENLSNEAIYDIYVIGYMGMQNIARDDDPQREIIGIQMIEPEYLHFEDVDAEGFDKPIKAVGYYEDERLGGRSANKFIPLYSIAHKEPNFYYGALNTTSESLQGKSSCESVIDLAIADGENKQAQNKYLRGKIFPSEIYSVDPTAYFNMVLNETMEQDEADDTIQDAVDQLSKFGEEGVDTTQTLALPIKVEKIQAGTVDGRLDGLETINRTNDVEYPRALKCPERLLGTSTRTTALSDTGPTHDILAFYKNVLAIRVLLQTGYKKLIKAKLNQRGITGEGGVKFNDNDPELKAMLTAASKEDAETGKLHIDMGTFNAAELRTSYVSGYLDLTKLPPEMEGEPDAPTQDGENQDEINE